MTCLVFCVRTVGWKTTFSPLQPEVVQPRPRFTAYFLWELGLMLPWEASFSISKAKTLFHVQGKAVLRFRLTSSLISFNQIQNSGNASITENAALVQK